MMTEDKLREVIEKLRGLVQNQMEPSEFLTHQRRDQLNHLITMPDKMLGFLAEGRREKLMRWLGFMQGALWMIGHDLEDLKKMNMPNE